MAPKTTQWFYIPVLGHWALLIIQVDRKNHLCQIWFKKDQPTVVKWGHFNKGFKKPNKILHSGGRAIWYERIGGPMLGWEDKNWRNNERFVKLLREGARHEIVLTPAQALAKKRVHKSFGKKPYKY